MNADRQIMLLGVTGFGKWISGALTIIGFIWIYFKGNSIPNQIIVTIPTVLWVLCAMGHSTLKKKTQAELDAIRPRRR